MCYYIFMIGDHVICCYTLLLQQVNHAMLCFFLLSSEFVIYPHMLHIHLYHGPLSIGWQVFYNVGVCFRGRAKVCGPLLLLIVGKVPGLYRYIQFEMKQQGLRNKSFCIIPCVCFIMSPWYIQYSTEVFKD